MSSTRRAISMAIAVAMVIVGFGGLGYMFLFTAWKGWMLMAAGGIGAGGSLWLYDDFINATPNAPKG